MSSSNEQDLLKFAKQQEQELGSQAAQTGHVRPGHEGVAPNSDSGVLDQVEARFPGAHVSVGGQGAGNNRNIPPEEGGGINPETGKPTKAKDFEGIGGPEDKLEAREFARPGDQDVQGNVRSGPTGNARTGYPNNS